MTGMHILLWRCLAIIALLLGVIGAVLPIMPTVPFILLAAWAASKGWPALEGYLLEHPVFGKPIRQWREHGAVSRRAKWFATAAMACSLVFMQFLPVPLWVPLSAALVFVAVLTWLWHRPEP
jgi:uncharacterized membrane protein YbaN (DUF454 family)